MIPPGSERRNCPWALATYVLVRDRRGRVLVLRRGPGSKHFPGLWELPGGKPDAHEDVGDTARRELAEETGLRLTLDGVAGAVDAWVQDTRVVLLIFHARSPTTRVRLSAEHDAARWLPLKDVVSLPLRPGFDDVFTGWKHVGPNASTRPEGARPV